MLPLSKDPLVVAVATALATCSCCDKVINLDEHWENVGPFLKALSQAGYRVTKWSQSGGPA